MHLWRGKARPGQASTGAPRSCAKVRCGGPKPRLRGGAQQRLQLCLRAARQTSATRCAAATWQVLPIRRRVRPRQPLHGKTANWNQHAAGNAILYLKQFTPLKEELGWFVVQQLRFAVLVGLQSPIAARA